MSSTRYGRKPESRANLLTALDTGLVREVLLLIALYCGIPAANEAHRAAIDVLKQI